MAESEKTAKTYPVVPTAHWWELRRKFQKSIPGVVSAAYVASVLNMQESSARANVLTGLRMAGIIDKDGKPTDLAVRWRDDGQYAAVCKEIIKNAYPSELRDAFPEPLDHRDGVKRWFAINTKGGDGVTEKFVKFYMLLNEADVTKASASSGKGATKAQDKPKAAKPKASAASAASKPPTVTHAPEPAGTPGAHAQHHQPTKSSGPAVHINLQVHISADASADQIEQVFASMAKHIYPRGNE